MNSNPFDWLIESHKDGPHVAIRKAFGPGTLDFGPVPDVLEDCDEPAWATWRHFHCGIVWDTDSHGTEPHRHALAQKRRKDEAQNAHVCNLWLQAFGLRVRDDRNWQALSLNRVLHPMFGPSLTAATNGVDVLLVSAPSTTADFILAHRRNVIGPVTGTPTAVAEWDWLGNTRKMRFGGPQGHTSGQGHTGPKKPSRKELLAML